jgi:hypothetical protein
MVVAFYLAVNLEVYFTLMTEEKILICLLFFPFSETLTKSGMAKWKR